MKTSKSLIPVEFLQRARAVRHLAVSTEHKPWQCLRDRQLGGFKFRRQHPKPPFIADFYCAEAKPIVETDGDSHAGAEAYDAARTIRLERDGLYVIRFVNDDVPRFLDTVLQEILRECERLIALRSPSPSSTST